MPIGMTESEVRTLCLNIGSLVRAAACWGMEKTQGVDTEFSERAVHYYVAEVFKAATLRDPNPAEIEIVWEQ